MGVGRGCNALTAMQSGGIRNIYRTVKHEIMGVAGANMQWGHLFALLAVKGGGNLN